jgi:hypothetical protein
MIMRSTKRGEFRPSGQGINMLVQVKDAEFRWNQSRYVGIIAFGRAADLPVDRCRSQPSRPLYRGGGSPERLLPITDVQEGRAYNALFENYLGRGICDRKPVIDRWQCKCYGPGKWRERYGRSFVPCRSGAVYLRRTPPLLVRRRLAWSRLVLVRLSPPSRLRLGRRGRIPRLEASLNGSGCRGGSLRGSHCGLCRVPRLALCSGSISRRRRGVQVNAPE